MRTLIMCRNARHRDDAIISLGISGLYELMGAALTGRRFNKIIVLTGGGTSDSHGEAEEFDRILREDLPSHLDVDGRLYVL